MLGFVCTVVAVLAIHLVLTDVNAVNEFDGLVGFVPFNNSHSHQALVTEHSTVRDEE
jgi:hypothetical protein